MAVVPSLFALCVHIRAQEYILLCQDLGLLLIIYYFSSARALSC